MQLLSTSRSWSWHSANGAAAAGVLLQSQEVLCWGLRRAAYLKAWCNEEVLSKDFKFSVPVALHGDGVPTVGIGKCWGKLMECYTWHGCLSKGGTKTTHILIWTAYQKFFQPGDGGTLDSVFRIIAWSFKSLFDGGWPSKNWKNGKCLCVSFRSFLFLWICVWLVGLFVSSIHRIICAIF